MQDVTGRTPAFSTTGGTSDGRFIAPTGAQVVELGVGKRTIHKVNECVRVEDIDLLSRAYERVMEKLLALAAADRCISGRRQAEPVHAQSAPAFPTHDQRDQHPGRHVQAEELPVDLGALAEPVSTLTSTSCSGSTSIM